MSRDYPAQFVFEARLPTYAHSPQHNLSCFIVAGLGGIIKDERILTQAPRRWSTREVIRLRGTATMVFLLAVMSMAALELPATPTNPVRPDSRGEKLSPEQVFLYQPETEWTYSHHPAIAFFKGRFFAIWSNGRVDEDAPGQRVLISTSEDFTHWSPPKPLLDSMPGEFGEAVLTAAGFHQYEGTLVAYAGRHEYAPQSAKDGSRPDSDTQHRNTTLLAMTTTDGESWTPPVDLKLPIVPNHPPQATRSGRLIISGNISYPYTDDPKGLSGWKMTGIYPPDMLPTLFDDSEGFWIVKKRMGWPVGLCEGSFFQTDDGILHMMLRSGTDRLWLTESSDDGATWSVPRETSFSDDRAKFHFGRLPDGRFYYVGNPDPGSGRNPLVLSLSKDGVHFDKHYILADEPQTQKRPGKHKGGIYAYPHTIVHDGMLYVIVSVCKESVLVMRVPLAALQAQ